MSSIPASELVNTVPGVIGVGGTAIDTIGLVLTTNTRVPIGTVLKSQGGAAVTTYFGAASAENTIANGGVGKGTGYFGGFTGSTKQPSSILWAQYNTTAVAAYLRGGNVSNLTLAQLQAISGSITVTMDGYPFVVSSYNLSAATSFSSAASLLQTAIDATEPTEASVTGSMGGSFTTSTSTGTTLTLGAVASGYLSVGDTVTASDGTNSFPAGTKILAQLTGTQGGSAGATFTLSHAATPGNLTSTTVTGLSNYIDVTVVGSGTLAVGQTVSGGITTGVITALGTGAGLTGTYLISGSPQTVASGALTAKATNPTVTYDSVSGAFVVTSGIAGAPSTAAFATGTTAATLMLTSATGAVLSQGAAAAVPAAFMNALVQVNPGWATFMTAFDPDGGSGNTVKQAFAAWKNTQNGRYGYVCFDTDITPTQSVPATSSLGYILNNNGDTGTCLIYEPSDLNLAAFICGAAASINFEQASGRITFAGKAQPNLVASVTDPTTAQNLGGNPQALGSFGNGYNFYGAYAQANNNFVFFQRGFCTGPFQWFDSFINQIWLNANFQNDLFNLIANSLSIPFSFAGAAIIEAALQGTIAAGLSFGAYGPDSLTPSQVAAVNAAAGSSIAGTLQAQGWYLQVSQQSPTVRANRGPWAINFWYIDQGSAQSFTINSTALQ